MVFIIYISESFVKNCWFVSKQLNCFPDIIAKENEKIRGLLKARKPVTVMLYLRFQSYVYLYLYMYCIFREIFHLRDIIPDNLATCSSWLQVNNII